MILNDAQVNRVWESLKKQKEIMLTAPARHMSEQEKWNFQRSKTWPLEKNTVRNALFALKPHPKNEVVSCFSGIWNIDHVTMCVYIYIYYCYMSIMSIYPCTKHQRLHRAGHLRLVSGFAPAGWNGWLSRSHLSRAKMALFESGILHICLGLENWIIIDGYLFATQIWY